MVSLVLDVAAQVRNGGLECGDGAHGGGQCECGPSDGVCAVAPGARVGRRAPCQSEGDMKDGVRHTLLCRMRCQLRAVGGSYFNLPW